MIFDNNDAPEVEVPTLREDAPSIESLRNRFNSYDSAADKARNNALLDRGYYDGDAQIGAVWREHLSKMNLPPVYINKVRSIVNGHIGVLLGQQTDPEALPRSEKDNDAAAVATKLLRYAADKSKLKQKFIDGAGEKFVEGIAALLVECTNEDIIVTRIPFREFIYDPHSREPDFSDAAWLGFARWISVDDVRMQWPEAHLRLGEPSTSDYMHVGGIGFADSADTWVDKASKRLQVITMYYKRNGRWMYVAWCHAGILDFDDSPYQDDKGRSLCPLVPMSCYVSGNVEENNKLGVNERYGIVRDLIMPQNEYNAHRAQALLHATSRKVQQVDPQAEVTDIELIRREAARPDAVLQPGWQFLPDAGMAEQINLLQLSDSELQRMGPTPAVLGRSLGSSESGRSRQVQAAAGLTEIAILLDRYERWQDAVYRMMWYQMRQYWSEQMVIRITGQDRAYQFLKINTPVLDENQPVRLEYVVGEDGAPVMDPMTGAPQTQEVPNIVGINNEVAQMDMDIIVTSTQEHANLEHEVWQDLIQFTAQTGIAPGDPRYLMMLEMAPLTNKREAIEKIEGMMKRMQQENAQAQQQQAQMQQMAVELETAQKQADIENKQAQTYKTTIDAQKTAAEAQGIVDENTVRAFLTDTLGGAGEF